MAGDSTSDGIPLLTRLLLVRATARFDPSFPNDAHRINAAALPLHPGRSPTSAAPPCPVHVNPTLRIAAHYAQNKKIHNNINNPSALKSATSTPKEDADFFAANASLHELLLALAADRLNEKVRLRQVQTDIARAAVKLARASAGASGGGAGAVAAAAAPPDATSFFSSSLTNGSSLLHRSGPLASSTSNDDDTSQSGGASSTQQVQGMLAAATATFAEDAAWRSLVTPYRPQLNPWTVTPVADEGCYLSLPSPAYAHWSELQAARCCATAGTDAGSTEPDVQCGPMRFNDVMHYASVNGVGKSSSSSGNGKGSSVAEEVGYLHGYTFLLDGAVFAGAGDQGDAADADDGPFSDDDGEVSVLLWCVLSDAPVYNFMRALSLEVVAAMSYVAQRTYHAAAETTSKAHAHMGAAMRADLYTGLLDTALDEEVVRPLAVELLLHGSTPSRTLPGATFTLKLPLTRGNQSGVAARPQTSSMSGNLTFRRPLDLLFPFADIPLSVLLLSFGEDALRVLQSLMLQEERIVVVGATPQHASACVVSLLGLIAPFTWVSPVVPYLPPHTAAHTGFLYTLLSSPYELQQQNQQQQQQTQQQQYGASVSPRPAPYSAGVAPQSSQQMESAGFLLGSTAGIRPYLMFLSAFGVTESDGQGGRSGRAPRVWIADARTGSVGVCPTEPISMVLLADSPTTDEGGPNSNGTVGRSCTALGGASPWTLAAHLDLRAAAPQMFNRPPTPSINNSGSSNSARGSRSARNPYVLYNTVRNTLRTAAELNVMDAAPVDVLPPFHDDLCDTLRRVASPEKRRQFRQALEELTQHSQVRMDNLASLSARLLRGLRQALKAAAAASGMTRQDSFSADSAADDDSNTTSSYSSSDSDSDEDDEDGGNTLQMDENASFRAVTEAVAQSHSVAFPNAASSAFLAQFPLLGSTEVWQVQSAFLGYVVGRLAGAYRRGITVVGGASHRGGGGGYKRRFMEASVFLTPGLEQHYTLAETVARTHLFRQFECAMLAMETTGLRRVLGGEGLQVGSGAHERGERAGESHITMRYIRPLALFAILCDRARLQFPDLYGDVPGLDAVGTVYTALLKHWFANEPAAHAHALVPPAIRTIAGNNSNDNNNGGSGGGSSSGNSSPDANRATVLTGGSSSGAYGSRSGGFRGFLAKAAKAMKIGSSNSSKNSGGGGGGSGGGRGLPVVYIPASVACMHSFSVAPFSEQHVAPQSFDITTYDFMGKHGKSRHHHHHRDHNGKKQKKKDRRRHGKHRADLYAIPIPPQRQQWARQQQHQQLSAMNIDFTLDECTSVVSNYNVPGGVSGSLTSSFSAASAAVAAAGGGVTNGSMYVSGAGMDTEVLTALARAGGSRGTGGSDAALRVMAETSLSVCHALPLDVVHQFDAYEPLLAPVLSSSTASASASMYNPITAMSGAAIKAAVADDSVTSPAAFMAVGLLCPSCVNVWREGEARATRVLQQQQQQQQPQQQQQQQHLLQPQQPKRGHSVNPPFHAHSLSALPPMPPRMMGASTPLEAQSWSTPPPSLPSQLLTSSGAPALRPMSMFGTFTSGAPPGYPSDGTPQSYPANSATMASSGGGGGGGAASAEVSTALASTRAPLLSAAASPTPAMPRTNAGQDAWDNWGVQAPVVVNSPNTATVRVEATTNTSLSSSPSGSPTIESRDVTPPLASVMTLESAALPLTAPAPGDVMDELFAGLSSYNANASTSNSASHTISNVPTQPTKRQTLDDFF